MNIKFGAAKGMGGEPESLMVRGPMSRPYRVGEVVEAPGVALRRGYGLMSLDVARDEYLDHGAWDRLLLASDRAELVAGDVILAGYLDGAYDTVVVMAVEPLGDAMPLAPTRVDIAALPASLALPEDWIGAFFRRGDRFMGDIRHGGWPTGTVMHPAMLVVEELGRFQLEEYILDDDARSMVRSIVLGRRPLAAGLEK